MTLMIEPKATRGWRSGRARIFAAGLAAGSLFTPLAAADAPLPARERATQASAVPANVWHGAQDLAIYALGLIGVDYKFGGTSPERGLDCS
jgi:cell wall-associated NlpC family hydrolase